MTTFIRVWLITAIARADLIGASSSFSRYIRLECHRVIEVISYVNICDCLCGNIYRRLLTLF